jgi:putative nucleotidyltransferase with HDIG domain
MTAPAEPRPRDGSAVDTLISLAACAATAAIVVTARDAWTVVVDRPLDYLAFLVLTLALQMMAVNVYGRGFISVSGIGVLAAGFKFGVGAGIMTALVIAVVHAARTRGKLHKSVFNAANLCLSAGAGALAFAAVTQLGHAGAIRFVAACVGGTVMWVANIGLLTLVMALAEGSGLAGVWRERFRWLTAHYLAFGPLAFACVLAFEKVGMAGLLAFAVPPALVLISVRQYLDRTREAVEEVRHANDELKEAIAELAARNDDLHDLFEFAGGLTAQTHDRHALVAYAQTALDRVTGARTRISLGVAEAGGTELVSGGKRIGALELEGGDAQRWERLRDAIVPQLATALESASLVEELRKTHLETIAALSRSMEAKDYYTGGHTERVSTIAVALAKRLGYTGPELDAIEIGALLHDIGKIGIPERILHKPGPLDEDEWKVMKEHPVISEYILSEIDLPGIVLQIARHSHERMDGAGYPDGLLGENIPLPARIVLAADAFDALTSDRPYRRGRRARAAMEELRLHGGTQFCPRVLEAFEQLYREEPHVLRDSDLRAVDAA